MVKEAQAALWGQREPEGFRDIFLGKLHLEQNLLRSGEREVCCPFPCALGFSVTPM